MHQLDPSLLRQLHHCCLAGTPTRQRTASPRRVPARCSRSPDARSGGGGDSDSSGSDSFGPRGNNQPASTMEDQQNLISNQERMPIMGVNSRSPRRSCSGGPAYTIFSLLAALLIAGQAVTVYFVYQQQQHINKLTLTSQNLQLESLQRKLPKSRLPFNKLRVAQPLPMMLAGPENLPSNTKLPLSNSTTDQVMHLLLKGAPTKIYPELNEGFQDNMEQLKNNMGHESWQNFKHWMHHWLLFELSKKPQNATPTETPKHVTPRKDLLEPMSSGLGLDLTQDI
uniref:CD74 molecule n=1 Tax=Ornithorhynchus anatinus TaxID=9258 RepID=A0A6I8NLD5_ORNAN